jgi:hypothetical protein
MNVVHAVGALTHDPPDDLFANAGTPYSTAVGDAAKDETVFYTSRATFESPSPMRVEQFAKRAGLH